MRSSGHGPVRFSRHLEKSDIESGCVNDCRKPVPHS